MTEKNEVRVVEIYVDCYMSRHGICQKFGFYIILKISRFWKILSYNSQSRGQNMTLIGVYRPKMLRCRRFLCVRLKKVGNLTGVKHLTNSMSAHE